MSIVTQNAARERAFIAMAKRAATPDPTEAEIREACLAIQATWCPREEQTRRRREPKYTFQELRAVDFCVG